MPNSSTPERLRESLKRIIDMLQQLILKRPETVPLIEIVVKAILAEQIQSEKKDDPPDDPDPTSE